jgi:hypothetical protein
MLLKNLNDEKNTIAESSGLCKRLELSIPKERQVILQRLGAYIQSMLEKKEIVLLNFICTHNSRRSQLCQVWAYTAAFHYFIPQAEIRFPVTYEDPKKSDGTSQEEQIYAERNQQIGSEMFYLFSQLK